MEKDLNEGRDQTGEKDQNEGIGLNEVRGWKGRIGVKEIGTVERKEGV